MSFLFLVSTAVVAAIIFYIFYTRTNVDFFNGDALVIEIIVLIILGAIITALFGDMILYSLIKWLSVPVILYAIYKIFE